MQAQETALNKLTRQKASSEKTLRALLVRSVYLHHCVSINF
jgi:ubiquinone biosynthesis protein UbiJ